MQNDEEPAFPCLLDTCFMNTVLLQLLTSTLCLLGASSDAGGVGEVVMPSQIKCDCGYKSHSHYTSNNNASNGSAGEICSSNSTSVSTSYKCKGTAAQESIVGEQADHLE